RRPRGRAPGRRARATPRERSPVHRPAPARPLARFAEPPAGFLLARPANRNGFSHVGTPDTTANPLMCRRPELTPRGAGAGAAACAASSPRRAGAYTVSDRPGHDTSVAACPDNPGCAPPLGLGGTGTGPRTLTLRGRTARPPYTSGDQ